jgi:hypothetical protein
VRFLMYAGGHRTGLIDARLYGVHHVPTTQATTLEYGWIEDGKPRKHQEQIPAESAAHQFHIETGSDIKDQYIRLSAE